MNAAALWVDSSVAHRLKWLREICELAQSKGIRVVAHAQIHLEMCRHQRENYGDEFSQDSINTVLDQLGIIVETATLDRAVAEEWAELLHARFPTSVKWAAAKASCVRARVPTSVNVAGKVPMTTDWLIALEVERRGDVVAVEDKGPQWQELRKARKALTADQALDWMKRA